MEKISAPRLEGIYKKGYGTIPKSVMHDPELSLESKAIYAYLCALAGSGKKTFPYRDTILRHLELSKNTYYRHYKPLVEKGFITVTRPADKSAANVYSLTSEGNNRKQDGYGIISRSVMTDENLSVKAKGLYAYLCSYCGTSRRAFPKKDNIIFHLGISESTYYKYYKQLHKLGYLTTIQRREGSLFGVNDYHLDSQITSGLQPSTRPVESAKKQKEPAVNSANSNHLMYSSNPNIWDMKNGDTVFRDTKNCDAYINNSNFKNNRFIINPSSPPAEESWTDGQAALILSKTVMDKLKTDQPNTFKWIDSLSHSESEELIPAFLSHFKGGIADKTVRNLSAYMKASLRNWLADYKLRREFGWRGKSPPGNTGQGASYSLEDIERVIDAGGCNG